MCTKFKRDDSLVAREITLVVASCVAMMRRMFSMRVLLTNACLRRAILLLPAASGVIGCAAEDTIVALTIESGDDVGAVANLHVTVRQEPDRELIVDFVPPTEETDAGPIMKRSFFERLTLSGGWERADARIEVEAQDEDGKRLFARPTTARIRPEGAVAASVMLGEDAAPMATDAGTEAGADPEDDAGQAAGDGGA
jgi:hypothetical protein